MELKTVAECDVALHYLDIILGDQRREYDDATKQSQEITQKTNIAWNLLCITQNEMRLIEQRKKELCGTNQVVSESSNVSSSLFQNVGVVVGDYVQEILTSTSVEALKTLND